jgi:hypothetical protein
VSLCVAEATRISVLRKRLKLAARNGKQIKSLIGEMEAEIDALKVRLCQSGLVALAGQRLADKLNASHFVVRRSTADAVLNLRTNAVRSAAR